MSLLTDYSENTLLTMLRGNAPTLPSTWRLALGSAASDSTFTECTAGSYNRQVVARDLASWAGTQGAGTTVASSGSSHATSNNASVSYGTPGFGWGTVAYVGFFDGLFSGNCWVVVPLTSPITVTAGVPVVIAPGAISLKLGLTGGMSNYLSNKLIDLIFRAQAYAWPANTYACLYTAAPTNAGGGTEVSGGSYARVAIAANSGAWSGTPVMTNGRSSNLNLISFPTPTADWGNVTHMGIHDASTGGNLMFWAPLTTPGFIASGATPPRFDIGALSITYA